MKVVINPKYGSPDNLELHDMQKPTPKADEILIQIHASSVTRADTMMRQGMPRFARLFIGLRKPKYPITGTGFAGEVVLLGSAVTQFKVGDQVFGESVFGVGTNAEYLCVSGSSVVDTLPNNMSYDEAAPLCDGAITSLNFLTKVADVQSGNQVLIYGASGSLGSAAVQIAKYYGAEVTAVCSAANFSMVQELGADYMIDYTQEDFTAHEKKYDIIYDAVGKISFSHCKQSLATQGVYLSPVLSPSLLCDMLKTSTFSQQKAKFSATGMLPTLELRDLLQKTKAMIEAGTLKTIIDRRYPLSNISKAHHYIETGHKQGNVIISHSLV